MARLSFAKVLIATLLGVLTTGWAASVIAASTYPTKNIMVVVPFPPGGRSDIAMRLLAPYLENELGVSIVILNKAGGGSSIGFKYLARSEADGYTIGLNTNAIVTAQYTVKENLDLRDYESIALINADPAVMAVATSGRWKDVGSFVKFAKENPKKLLVGINPGASAHIFAASFLKAAKIDALLVPYKGGSLRVAALAGGHIDADFGVFAQYRAMIDSKLVRVLAVAANERMPDHKGIPTFKETGVDFEISGWQGFFAPKGLPAGVMKRLGDSIKAVLTNPEVIQKLKKLEVEVTYKPSKDFAGFLKREDTSMRQLIKELGLMVSSPK